MFDLIFFICIYCQWFSGVLNGRFGWKPTAWTRYNYSIVIPSLSLYIHHLDTILTFLFLSNLFVFSVCNFFRKPSRNKNIRKRTVDEGEDEDKDSKTEGSFLHSQKKTIKPDNKLTGSSKNTTSTEAKNLRRSQFFSLSLQRKFKLNMIAERQQL